jgi:hypothetical protein
MSFPPVGRVVIARHWLALRSVPKSCVGRLAVPTHPSQPSHQVSGPNLRAFSRARNENPITSVNVRVAPIQPRVLISPRGSAGRLASHPFQLFQPFALLPRFSRGFLAACMQKLDLNLYFIEVLPRILRTYRAGTACATSPERIQAVRISPTPLSRSQMPLMVYSCCYCIR